MSNGAASGQQRIVLFTAFEPSGDAHAAPVIEALQQAAPDVRIFGCGGPKMAATGIELLARTADDGSMALGAIAKANEVRGHIKDISGWARHHRVALHVPVDSPAANFPLCKALRKQGTRTVHLVAPQLWAWGSRRIKKLRKRTDFLLCLLPFEEPWFNERDVPARFIGHPAINREIDEKALAASVKELPHGAPRVALLPGSRSQEVKANLRTLVTIFNELRGRHNQLTGLVVAANDAIAADVRRRVKTFPGGLHMVVDKADAAMAWADLAVTVSGTVSLHLTRHLTPMVGIYKINPISWLGSKFIIRTPFRLLPNIIAEREIVPEYVPYCHGPGPIIRDASELLADSKKLAIQKECLRRVCLRFANKRPAEEAAALIGEVMETGRVG